MLSQIVGLDSLDALSIVISEDQWYKSYWINRGNWQCISKAKRDGAALA
jgi:hypothetical protein